MEVLGWLDEITRLKDLLLLVDPLLDGGSLLATLLNISQFSFINVDLVDDPFSGVFLQLS